MSFNPIYIASPNLYLNDEKKPKNSKIKQLESQQHGTCQILSWGIKIFSLFLPSPSLSPSSLSNPGAFPLKPPPSSKEETFPSGKYVPRYEAFLLVIIVLSAYCSRRHFLCCCRCRTLFFVLSYVFPRLQNYISLYNSLYCNERRSDNTNQQDSNNWQPEYQIHCNYTLMWHQ